MSAQHFETTEETFPFRKIHIYAMLPDIECMLCGYRDVITVFQPPLRTETETSYFGNTTTIKVTFPEMNLFGKPARDVRRMRCPMCIAKKEGSLGDKIWNRL